VNPVFNRAEMAQRYYGNSHCLVYTSIMEGWGRCLAEAMATGMPVICFRSSSMLDQFVSHAGWWVEQSGEYEGIYPLPSVGDLAFCMQLAQRTQSCRQRGVWGREYAQEHLTWQSGIKKAMPILEEIYAS
jgi:glycosyltransferase involved in cell wall biosynthesis